MKPLAPPLRRGESASRRRFLRRLAGASLVVGGGGLLSACGAAPTGVSGALGADDSGQKDASASLDGESTSTDGRAESGETMGGETMGGGEADSQGADASTCSTAPTGAPEPCRPTGADLAGPYYEADATSTMTLADAKEPGERLRVQGRVFALGCGSALAKTTIEVWHADKDGKYRELSHATPLRATLAADCSGRFSFDTILPGAYLDLGGYRPKHIHFRITTPKGKVLITQLYFEGDPYLAPKDSCGICKSGDASHIVKLTSMAGTKKGSLAVFDVVV